MGRPPAYIFIVRHGNRLDAADKLWHLSSPTPYDPPLTYGGWTQARSIGQRIAEILRESSSPDSSSSSTATTSAIAPSSPDSPDSPSPHGRTSRPSKKRRYRIIIHSSPFLRCIQTSVGVSAGIAADPLLRSALSPQNGSSDDAATCKSLLRLDAFLGEWLSPKYFELITPPPSSFLMVASAKAELLRREDYSSSPHLSSPHSHHQHHHHSHSSSQLWGSSRSNTWSANLSGAGDLPTSGSQPVSPPTLPLSDTPANADGTSAPAGRTGYMAPVPHFAVSSKAPVPSAYVAHARDHCIDFDYQWDSMRPPFDWGDGGEFGEEWTSMHLRFRKGLQLLVDWYTADSAPAEPVTKALHLQRSKASSRPRPAAAKGASSATSVDDRSSRNSMECAIDDNESVAGDDAEDDDSFIEEPVVILVSHGAGCNALIGAITQLPALMDVGLASLTMAQRRPLEPGEVLSIPLHKRVRAAGATDGAVAGGRADTTRQNTLPQRSRSSRAHPGGIVPLNEYYDMKLVASTHHLRPSTSSAAVSRVGSMATVFAPRGRHSNSLSSAFGSLGLTDSGATGYRSASAGAFHGSSSTSVLRRSSAVSSRPTALALQTGAERAHGRGLGITIGSGVTSFAPPETFSSADSRSNSPLDPLRRTSIGLWSPVRDAGDVDLPGEREAGPGRVPSEVKNTAVEPLKDDDDDLEILLSFGPEHQHQHTGPSPLSEAQVRQDDASRSSGSGSLAGTSSRIDRLGAGTPPVPDDPANPAAVSHEDAASSTGTAFPQLGHGSGGLWGQPRPSDELERVWELASPKRRWSVNERA